MNKERLTVHRALAELKTIDSRITKAINTSKFVIANKHSNEKIDGKPISEVRENMKSAYQKVTDLIARRNAIKRAVVLSNANTNVVVNGVTYTVAEAIDMKNHGMELKNYLLCELERQKREAESVLTKNSGEAIEKKAEQYVLSVIQAQPKESKCTVDDDSMKTLRVEYIKNNTYDLIDPVGVAKIMESLTDEIDAFNVEIDAALSVSNAITTIEFEY